MLRKKINKKVYNFRYKIYWKNGDATEGIIENSEGELLEIFLTNSLTYFSKGVCAYFNSDEIRQIEIYDLVEKVEKWKKNY